MTLAALKEKKLPALDDEFAGAVAEGDTVETLREKVRTRLRHEKEADRRRKFRRVILDGLLSRREIPAPEVLVESETIAALRDYARYLAQSGVDPEKEDWQKLADRGPPRARSGACGSTCCSTRSPRRRGIAITETELEAEFKRAAAQRGRRARGPAGADGQGGRHRIPARRDAPVPGRGPLD